MVLLWSALQHAVTVLMVLPAMVFHAPKRQQTTWPVPVGSKGPRRRQIEKSAIQPTTLFTEHSNQVSCLPSSLPSLVHVITYSYMCACLIGVSLHVNAQGKATRVLALEAAAAAAGLSQ